jgi:tRNA threonylcarbamoyladenosine biosynthesis protein TsaB
VPAIGVTRLEALAYGLPRPVTVLDDARREAVYMQEFGHHGPGPAQLIALGAALINGQVAGPGAGLIGRVPLPQTCSLVEAIARIAFARIGTPQPPPAPFYLRGADAAPPSDPPPVILDA